MEKLMNDIYDNHIDDLHDVINDYILDIIQSLVKSGKVSEEYEDDTDLYNVFRDYIHIYDDYGNRSCYRQWIDLADEEISNNKVFFRLLEFEKNLLDLHLYWEVKRVSKINFNKKYK